MEEKPWEKPGPVLLWPNESTWCAYDSGSHKSEVLIGIIQQMSSSSSCVKIGKCGAGVWWEGVVAGRGICAEDLSGFRS